MSLPKNADKSFHLGYKLTEAELEFFYEQLPKYQSDICKTLLTIIRSTVPISREKFSYRVPFFSMNRRLAFIWPTAIKGSGVKDDGVLLGFWYGNEIADQEGVFRGQKNKIVRFVVYEDLAEIDAVQITGWLMAAEENDSLSKQSSIVR